MLDFSRRALLQTTLGLSASAALPEILRASVEFAGAGNPLLPGQGVCDPQIRVYDDVAFMYSTHDASPENHTFTMRDWQVFSSRDLVRWEKVSVLKPEQTYLHNPSTECWATDAISHDGKYFIYFSMGPKNIGVVVGETPAGPWRDPLGHPLIAEGLVPTEARDPGILQEADGTTYIVFGTFDYYIARLADDMISLAEKPKLIAISDKQGPYGVGKTDDKPFLHRHEDFYYLSWGSYYGVGRSPYGPFHCRGSLLKPENVESQFLNDAAIRGPYAPPPQYRPKDWLNFDRHGSFFTLHGQWYFACNDQSRPGATPLYRDSVLTYVKYKDDGDIAPIKLSRTGVGRYDGRRKIEAADFFAIKNGSVRESGAGFEVALGPNGSLYFPNVTNLIGAKALRVDFAVAHPRTARVEVREGGATGRLLGSGKLSAENVTTDIQLRDLRNSRDFFLTFPDNPVVMKSLHFMI